MVERIAIVEDLDVTQQLSAEIALWGNLEQVDRYDTETARLYGSLIENAREHIGQSLVAAALVSARDGAAEDSPYDIGPNIQKALDTADKVRSLQAFAEQHPDDVGLYLGDNHLLLFKFDEMDMTPYYLLNSTPHAYLSVDAPLQTGITSHGGQLSRHIQTSDRHEAGRRGGYQLFVTPFNELRNGLVRRMARHHVPPLTFGRTAIANLFSAQAFNESVHAGTHHRQSSLAYGIWLVRHEDEQLAATMDDVCETVGLVNLWTEQYRREIGAKAAHLILSKQAPISWLQQTELTEPSWFNDEPSIYGQSPELYLEFAQQQAHRIGAEADEATLKDAIKAVFNRLEG
ncbi:MAG: hypothetical protein JWN38_1074 [Candidatus Saccharibacteria bacterium]|nr:hypothetical protein [Candidatus Saccharibacteria bacterium]